MRTKRPIGSVVLISTIDTKELLFKKDFITMKCKITSNWECRDQIPQNSDNPHLLPVIVLEQ